jgi:hypothetical protein
MLSPEATNGSGKTNSNTELTSTTTKRMRYVYAKDMIDIVRTTASICPTTALELNQEFLNILSKSPILRGYLSKTRMIELGLKIDDEEPLPLKHFLDAVSNIYGFHLSRNINMPNMMDKVCVSHMLSFFFIFLIKNR